MKNKAARKYTVVFAVTLLVICAVFLVNVVQTDTYNNTVHKITSSGPALFSANVKKGEVSVSAEARGSTWTKVFDLNNEGLQDHNYQAFTYDFSILNNSGDEVYSFAFRLTFGKRIFLLSGWNGSVEIHQLRDGGEKVSAIPDLRDYNPADYDLETVVFDGETLIDMQKGDYFNYIPSSSESAREMPIRAHEATIPGFILYTEIGTDISDATLEMEYKYHKFITTGLLFWISAGALAAWLVALLIYTVTSAKIRKYRQRHERDNEIINESIETFTGFIDAKDPYTNGHSKRVAKYTRFIAEKMGYEGEELDRIYYVALLHDCGKIGVPDNILGKPGRLTDEEFEVIKSHTVRGGEILHHFKSLEDVDEGALYHHERYDGKGYPKGLAGEDIPLIARIICVADAFDAMNSNRVYRNRLTKENIINEIEVNKGRQFDPKIADIMLKLLRDPDNPLDF